ncbi:MAG: transcription antitermination factor NusB [Christensenellales bacterium]|jgi:16S rRNA (cytosine967-C5)-methyltransferase
MDRESAPNALHTSASGARQPEATAGQKAPEAGAGAAPARDAALDVLMETIYREGYANLLLKRRAAGVPDADRNMLYRLVYGSLERRATLEFALEELWKPGGLPPVVKELILLGAYQILYMDQVPDAAACNEAVKQAKRRGHVRLSGAVNGILRALSRRKEDVLKAVSDMKQTALDGNRRQLGGGLAADSPQFGDIYTTQDGKTPQLDAKIRAVSVFGGAPVLIARKMVEQYGPEAAIGYFNKPLPNDEICLRINTLKISREDFFSWMDGEGWSYRKGLLDAAVYVKGVGDISRTRPYLEGWIAVQSESSQLIARALGMQNARKENLNVLDACAAPGGKTMALADLMGNRGRIMALDVHPHRVELIAANARRLGVANVTAAAGDAGALSEEFHCAMDAVLCDVPCSGLSVPGKPEAALRIRQEDFLALNKEQNRILNAAALAVAPGGVLLYSTCTWNRRENECVAEAFLEAHPEFATGTLENHVPERLRPYVRKGCTLQLWPARDGLPAFFMARWRRLDDAE